MTARIFLIPGKSGGHRPPLQLHFDIIRPFVWNMKKGSCLIFVFLVFATVLLPAQDLRLPRDPERLIERVQKFWSAMTSGQRLQALEFILPEKKELFLTGTPIPILKANVLGLDLTTAHDRAAVRINIEVLAKESASGRLNWTITDSWVWRRNNWYLNLESPPSVFPKSASAGALDLKEAQTLIDKNFEILRNPIDFGKLNEGQFLRMEVPIRYTGDLPVSVELALPNPLVDISADEITSHSNHLVLLVGAENWEGPFDLPLPLKIRQGAATVERTLRVKGSVFVPLAFRQSPPNGPIEEGREFSVFIRNNSSQQVGIRFISVDAKFSVLKRPETLPPDQEAEVVLKLRPGESPDRMYVQLDAPLEGRDMYTYRFRNARR